MSLNSHWLHSSTCASGLRIKIATYCCKLGRLSCVPKMIVPLVDGTYELFRHFYGLRRFNKGKDRPYGAVVGVLQTVLQMIDHVKGSASRGQSVEGLDSNGKGDA